MLTVPGEIAALVLAALLGLYVGWLVWGRGTGEAATRHRPRHAASRRTATPTTYGTDLAAGEVRVLARSGRDGRHREPAHSTHTADSAPSGAVAELTPVADEPVAAAVGQPAAVDRGAGHVPGMERVAASVAPAVSAGEPPAGERAEDVGAPVGVAAGERDPAGSGDPTGEGEQAIEEPSGAPVSPAATEASEQSGGGEPVQEEPSAVPAAVAAVPPGDLVGDGRAMQALNGMVGGAGSEGGGARVPAAFVAGATATAVTAPISGVGTTVAVRAVAPSPNGAVPGDQADDLRQVVGIGPVIQRVLVEAGIRTYRQLAQLPTDQDALAALGGDLRARIERQRWVEQARELHFRKYGERL